jgi:putative membrane protein
MDSLFDKPQRQSAIGILVLFFDTLYHYIKAFGPLLLIFALKFKEIEKLYLILSIIALVLVVGLIAYLKYLNFTFYLDHQKNEFVIQEGIFNKTKTTVQFYKIQQVNITQNLLQRAINVYSIEVDTAGSNDKEGKIKAISHDLALELKAALLQNESKVLLTDATANEVEITEAKAQPFLKISLLSLVKMGITSNYVKSLSLMLIFIFTILDYVEKVVGQGIYEKNAIEGYINLEVIVQSIFVFIFILIIVIVVINLGRILIKYYDYNVNKQQGSLLISYGLINTHSTIVKPEKVQITSVSRNFFQKKLNVLELKIKQAMQGNKVENGSAIDIPGCNEVEKDAILQLIFQRIPQKGAMLKPNFRKLGFAVFLTIILPLLCYLRLRVLITNFDFRYDYFAAIYVVFVGIVQYFKFRNSRLFIDNNFIILQSGAWDISNDIIEPNRIQAITTSQLFWHKNINIGSLTLHTAGGNIAFQLGDFEKIRQYVNMWLYELEKSDSNWM